MTNNLRQLLQQIILHPKEDHLRLMYADALDEEAGEATPRGEFIRVQCELATLQASWPECEGPTMCNDWGCCNACVTCARDGKKWEELRRRERELMDKHKGEWNEFIHEILNKEWREQHKDRKSFWNPYQMSASVEWYWTRGFISITCTAEDFLKHADALVWNEGMTDKCGNCQSTGVKGFGMACKKCPDCDRGYIHRPMPDTAQPIEKVKLTTWPDRDPFGDAIHVDGKVYFGRWQRIVFELPDYEQQIRRNIIGETVS